jgi:hypothetical protein
LTFQHTADPAVEDVAALVVAIYKELDLARVEGRELEPVEADAKQVVDEFPYLIDGVAGDEQARGHLPHVAPCPPEDAGLHGRLRRQEREDLRQDLVRKLAEAVGGVDCRSRCVKGSLPASCQRGHRWS